MVEEYEKLTAAALGYAKEIESGALTKDEVLQKKVLIKQILSKCQVVENEVIINSVESRAIGGRGVWHCADVNSTEPDIEGIRRTLSIVADAGMNVLFVEAAAEGFAYFKSDMMNYSPRFVSRKYKYYSYEEMLDKENLDVVHICLPHYLHCKYACMAFERGINVITEKPMDIGYEVAENAVKKAKECNVLYAFCFN